MKKGKYGFVDIMRDHLAMCNFVDEVEVVLCCMWREASHKRRSVLYGMCEGAYRMVGKSKDKQLAKCKREVSSILECWEEYS